MRDNAIERIEIYFFHQHVTLGGTCLTLTFLPPLVFISPSFAACVDPRGAVTDGRDERLLLLLHGNHLYGDAALPGVRLDARAAGGVSRQTGTALAARLIQV